MFAALYYWTPLVNGHALSERLGALGLRADVRRLQPRLLPDAHRRPARHAAARLHLCRRARLERSGTCCRPSARSCSPPASLLFVVDAVRTWRRPRADARQPVAGADARMAAGRRLRRAQHPARCASREPLVDQPGAGRQRSTAGAHWLPGTDVRRPRDAGDRAARGARPRTCCCCRATAGGRSSPPPARRASSCC